MIIMYAFNLWQSAILKLKVITSSGAHTEICFKLGNYEVTHLSKVSSYVNVLFN